MQQRISAKKKSRQDAITHLKRIIKSGATVYPVKRHTSRSQKCCFVAVYIVKEGKVQDVTEHIARAFDMVYHPDHRGAKIIGLLTPVYDLVRALSKALYDDYENLNCVVL